MAQARTTARAGREGHPSVAFLTGPFPAVSETFILAQVNGLAARGHHVTVICEPPATPAREGPHAAVRVRHVFPAWAAPAVRRLPPRLRLAVLVALRWPRLRRALARDDAIIANFGWHARAVARVREAAGGGGAALLSIFHGSDLSRHLRRHGAGHYDAVFRQSALLLPVSRHFAGVLRASGAQDARIRVYHMGVHTDVTPAAPEEGGPVRIVTIGRLVPKKGMDDLLRALAALPDAAAQPGWTCTVIGDGPLRPALEAKARTLGLEGRVTFTGAQPHARTKEILRGADLFALASKTAPDGDVEGVPVVLMEAMALGLPVASTRHSGIPELVEDGSGGLLAEEGDTDALAQNLAALIADPALRRRLGAAGREKVRAEFDLDEQIATLDKMVREAAFAAVAPAAVPGRPGDTRAAE